MTEVPHHLGTFCERKSGQLTQWSFVFVSSRNTFLSKSLSWLYPFPAFALRVCCNSSGLFLVFFLLVTVFLCCIVWQVIFFLLSSRLHFIVPGHGQLFGNVPFSRQVKLRPMGSSGGPVLSLNRETLCLPKRRRTQQPVPFEKTGGTLIVLLWQPRCVCLSFQRKESVQSCGFRPSSIRTPRVLNLQTNRPTL